MIMSFCIAHNGNLVNSGLWSFKYPDLLLSTLSEDLQKFRQVLMRKTDIHHPCIMRRNIEACFVYVKPFFQQFGIIKSVLFLC